MFVMGYSLFTDATRVNMFLQEDSTLIVVGPHFILQIVEVLDISSPQFYCYWYFILRSFFNIKKGLTEKLHYLEKFLFIKNHMTTTDLLYTKICPYVHIY